MSPAAVHHDQLLAVLASELMDNVGNRITPALVEGLVLRVRSHAALSQTMQSRVAPPVPAMEPVDLSTRPSGG